VCVLPCVLLSLCLLGFEGPRPGPRPLVLCWFRAAVVPLCLSSPRVLLRLLLLLMVVVVVVAIAVCESHDSCLGACV
jgi:hypothetical protein